MRSLINSPLSFFTNTYHIRCGSYPEYVLQMAEKQLEEQGDRDLLVNCELGKEE